MTEFTPTVVTEKTDQVTIVRVRAKILDDQTLAQLNDAVDAVAADPPKSAAIIDIAMVEFLPSLYLGALVQLAKKCRERSQKLTLAGVRPAIRKVLVVTHLDRSFEVCESVEAGVKAHDAAV